MALVILAVTREEGGLDPLLAHGARFAIVRNVVAARMPRPHINARELATMPHCDCWLSLGIFVLQMLGLASVALARVQMPSLCRVVRQRLFMGCWLLVGCATLGAASLGSGCWISCSTIFSVMAVGAIFDGGNGVPASSF